jgi:protein phosphatase
MVFEFPDGRRVPVLVNVAPVYGEDGRIASIVAAIQDISGLTTLLEERGTGASPETAALARTNGALLELGDASERGLARETNEDSVYCEPPGSARAQAKGWVFAVADGMGGEAVGELASRTAAAALVDAYYRSPGGAPALAKAASEANQAVRALAASKLQYAGMGTTLTAGVIQGSRLAFAHVGDSRAYLVRSGRARQLTQDHSWVAELVRAGALTQDQLRTHRYRNVLTRALGRQDQVQIDVIERELEDGDTLVLCSDGVTGKVEDPEIARLVAAQTPPRAAASLVSLARTRGGDDDASAVVVRWRRSVP